MHLDSLDHEPYTVALAVPIKVDGLVNAVDPLHVPGHGLDAGLLIRAHGLVEQVVRLQIQHAGLFLFVNFALAGQKGLAGLAAPPKVVLDAFRHIGPIDNFVGGNDLFGTARPLAFAQAFNGPSVWPFLKHYGRTVFHVRGVRQVFKQLGLLITIIFWYCLSLSPLFVLTYHRAERRPWAS